MIKRIRIQNFKSLEDVAVMLEPVTVLIGRSGSGKTNFVQAIRWLRDLLQSRNPEQASEKQLVKWGGNILPAGLKSPAAFSYALVFSVPGFDHDFTYNLSFEIGPAGPVLANECLTLGEQVLFHQTKSGWEKPPPLATYPNPNGQVMLGALTGLQEATMAYLVLTAGIGCYSFSDRVLCSDNHGFPSTGAGGLRDDAVNFVQTFDSINTNFQSWRSIREIVASLKRLKPNLKSLDLEQPNRARLLVTTEVGQLRHLFELDQESEGFRRLLSCLLAIYQTPAKHTYMAPPVKSAHVNSSPIF